MVRYLFIDLDDTLFDFRAAEREALKKTLRHLGIEPTDELVSLYSEINAAHWRMLERGEITQPQVKVLRYKVFFETIGVERSAEEAAAFYSRQLGMEHQLLDGAIELLDALYGKYRLFTASNGIAEVQRNRVAMSGIGRYFDDIFISQELGSFKPAKEFFDGCFARIEGFRREEAVIFGDSLTSDIKGGINAGIRTVWFNPRGAENTTACRPDYELSSLSQLPALLEKL